MRATLFHMERRSSNWAAEWPQPEHVRRLEDPAAARLLASRHDIALLRPFHGREATVSEAARENGIGVKSMYYRVSRWHRQGILQVVREVRRPGKPLKVYSTGCDWLIVPHTLTPWVDVDELTAQEIGDFVGRLGTSYLRDHLPEATAFHILAGPDGRFGFPVGPDDVGAVRRPQTLWQLVSGAGSAHVPGVFQGFWGPLQQHEAEEFERKLRGLYQETGQRLRQNRLSGTGRTYGIFVAFAPFEEEDG